MHIELSDPARKFLAKKALLYSGKGRKPRLLLASQSCRGAEFRLFFDFPALADHAYDCEGVKIYADPHLMQKFGGFKISTQSFFFKTELLIEPMIDNKECTCKCRKEE